MNRTVNLSRSHRNESEEWRFWVHKGDDSSAITEKRHKMADSRSCSSFFPRVDKLRRQRAGEENSVQWKLCIDEQAGLPISKPPFFLKISKLQGVWPAPNLCCRQKQCTSSIFILTCTWGMTDLNLTPKSPPNPNLWSFLYFLFLLNSEQICDCR